MTEITSACAKFDAWKKEMEQWAKRVPPELSRAIRNLMTAISYADEILTESSVASFWEFMALSARDIVQKYLEAARGTKEGLREGWQEYIDGTPRESFQELRKIIESFIDDRIAEMTNLQDGLVRLVEEEGYPIENKKQLEDGLRDLFAFKESMFTDWPNEQPGPINKQAIGEARASISQKEKWLRKEDMVYPSKGKSS